VLLAMRRLALILPAAAVLVHLAGCSAPASDDVGRAEQGLGILVGLPTVLGGGVRLTSFTPSVRAVHVYSVGLVGSAHQAKTSGGLKMLGNGATPPPAVDLSQGAPSPGDQGQTGSCAAWATGYSSMGWWAAKSGLGGAPFAPMYLYAQEVQGQCDQGTSIEGNLDLLQQQGIDTTADYEPMEQNLDCATQPSAQEQSAAAAYAISGYQQLDLSSDPRGAIEQALAAGIPVVLGILAYDELMNATAQSFLVGPPAAGSQLYGGHAIAAFKYDDKGVWILNSWTDQWGYQGWAELSWDFIEGSNQGQSNLMDAAAITGVAGMGNGP
jgi:hypothetical protein